MTSRAHCTLAAVLVPIATLVAQESTTPFDAARVVADHKMHMELVDDLNGDGFPDALGFWWQGDNLNGVEQAANQALEDGLLSPGANGVLPGAGAGVTLSVDGVSVQMIGGRVIDGVVHIGSFIGL